MLRGKKKLSRNDDCSSSDFVGGEGLPSTTGGVEAVGPDVEGAMAKFAEKRRSASLLCHVLYKWGTTFAARDSETGDDAG